MPLAYQVASWADMTWVDYTKLITAFVGCVLLCIGGDLYETVTLWRAEHRKPTPPQRQASQWRHPSQVDT